MLSQVRLEKGIHVVDPSETWKNLPTRLGNNGQQEESQPSSIFEDVTMTYIRKFTWRTTSKVFHKILTRSVINECVSIEFVSLDTNS